MREARHWGAFPETFRAARPDARVIALDLPGNGALNALASPTRIEDAARLCREAAARAGAVPPYNLLAISLGAMVASHWCRIAPGEVAACVLIGTSLKPFSPVHRRLRPENYAALLRLLLGPRDPAREERAILAATANSADARAAVLEDWIAYARERPVARRNVLRQLFAASRCRAPAEPPPVPTLLLAGAADPQVDPHCTRDNARAWNVPLIVHPTAGHDVPLDDGPWVAGQVRDWLARLEMEYGAGAPIPPYATRHSQ
jgi:pimeloyl-ACP methyl ester carboxylesterase